MEDFVSDIGLPKRIIEVEPEPQTAPSPEPAEPVREPEKEPV